MSSAVLHDAIETVLADHRDQIETVEQEWPDVQSIRLDWQSVDDRHEAFAKRWLTQPDQTQERTEEVLRKEFDAPHDTTVRIWNLPERRHVRVGKSRTRHLGQLHSLQGEVVDIDGVAPFATEVAWLCGRCGTLTRLPGSFGKLHKPSECMGCETGKNQAGFRFKQDQSEMIDQQKVVVVPADSPLEEPPAVPVYLRKDLCDTVGPGDIVSLVGEYKTFPAQDENPLSTYILAYDLDQQERHEADAHAADELDDRIKSVAQELQDEGPAFEANVETLIERLTDRGIREQEVRDRLDDLDDRGEVNINGETMMVL